MTPVFFVGPLYFPLPKLLPALILPNNVVNFLFCDFLKLIFIGLSA